LRRLTERFHEAPAQARPIADSGVHTSVGQLEADIRAYIDRHNENPKPFKWTKSSDQVLASVKRLCHKAQQTSCCERHIHGD